MEASTQRTPDTTERHFDMAPKNAATTAALDRFGRYIVAPARDGGIKWFDVSCAHAPLAISDEAGPEVKAMNADLNTLAELPPPVRQAIHRTVVYAINASIHDLLVRLSDESRQKKCTIMLDGVNLFEGAWENMYWPGLEGGLYGEDGWYARFSQYGEYGDRSTS
jgi:hypothetical protein